MKLQLGVIAALVGALCGVGVLAWFVIGKERPTGSVVVTNQAPRPGRLESYREEVVPRKHRSNERPPSALGSEEDDRGAEGRTEAGRGGARKTLGAEREILNKLIGQGVVSDRETMLWREVRALDHVTVERLGRSSDWIRELNKAASTVQVDATGESSLLRLERIAEDSVLRQMGLQPGDTIALLNEETRSFTVAEIVELNRLAHQAADALRDGKPVSVTVVRNGEPLHFVYRF